LSLPNRKGLRLDAETIGRWADLLVDYCLRVERGETILIASELAARPLVEACFKAVVRRGAYPIVRVELAGLHEFFLENASDVQLGFVSPTALYEAGSVDGRIRIDAGSDRDAMAKIDPARQAIYERSRDPIRQAARRARWVLTQYPSASFAKEAEMPLKEYERFVSTALFLDHDDPGAEWTALGKRQAGLVEWMSSVGELRIEAEGTDLRLNVAGRTWINSDGRRNMPSGEIFTGPVEDSANGRLRCGFPVCRDGRRLVGIELEFKDGKVVACRADEGEEYLQAMLTLDEGASRVGELGLGLNRSINQFTGSILFDEKIGGTVHVALGQSYPETGGVNASALHWDLIIDTRKNGRITADGRTLMENGWWLVG
jgi:aminopeptidase